MRCRKGSLQHQAVDLAAGTLTSPWAPLLGNPTLPASGTSAQPRSAPTIATSYRKLISLQHIPPTKMSFFQARCPPPPAAVAWPATWLSWASILRVHANVVFLAVSYKDAHSPSQTERFMPRGRKTMIITSHELICVAVTRNRTTQISPVSGGRRVVLGRVNFAPRYRLKELSSCEMDMCTGV